MVPELLPGFVNVLFPPLSVVVLMDQKPRLAYVVGRMAIVIDPVDVGKGYAHCPATEVRE
jgi:hypothetical protein